MMAPPERLPERDAAIEAMLPHVPFDGWTKRALRAGSSDRPACRMTRPICCFPSAPST